jgi:hypothetical protein
VTLATNVTRGGLAAAGLALGAALVAWLVAGGAMFSPGDLSAASEPGEVLGGVPSHAALGRRCAACHATLVGGQPMSTQCLTCHSDTRAELGDSTSLHGGFRDARECLACHTEHGGPTASLVRVGSGTGDHARFGFSLAAHVRSAEGRAFRCADCHRPGAFTFDSGGCEECHREYQATFVTAHAKTWGTSCVACHDGTDRFTRGHFKHDTTVFKLLGAHRRAECSECHREARTLADFGTAAGECASCHRKDDAHRGEFGDACGECHTVSAWTPATFEGQDHARLGFALDAHRRTSAGRAFRCGDCHDPGTFKFDEARCTSCHRDYQAEFVVTHTKAWGPRCRDCHDGLDRFGRGRFQHDSTGFKLLGAHERTSCAACHVGTTKLAGYRTASRECVSCHRKDDEHGGRFGIACGSCHTVTAWKPATFDHKASKDCVSCHRKDDEHRGEFGTDCATCHSIKAWRPATMKHTFPLDHGERGRTACTVCHEPGRPYPEYTCYGCHEHTPDRIAREHREEGIGGARLNDCVRCHPSGREHEGDGDD